MADDGELSAEHLELRLIQSKQDIENPPTQQSAGSHYSHQLVMYLYILFIFYYIFTAVFFNLLLILLSIKSI